MNYEIIKLSNENKKPLDEEKVIKFLKNNVGLKLAPVRGKPWYWIQGKDGFDLIDGPKYYKVCVDKFGLSLEAPGGFNCFSMKGQLIDWIKEAIKKIKEEKWVIQ